MSQFDFKRSYRRQRPHFHPPGSTLFVTARLAGSVPRNIVREYKARRKWFLDSLLTKPNAAEVQEAFLEFERQWFRRFEGYLHKVKSGPMWLGEPEIRQLLFEKLLEGDGDKYRLDAFSIMSNHLHIVFRPNLDVESLSRKETGELESSEDSLGEIMQWLKGGSARRANEILGRSGSFWESESFDRYIRTDAEFDRTVRYVLNNPVKAGLVSKWQDWPGNFLAERLRERF